MWKRVINWIIGILLLLSLICNGLQFYCLKHKSAPECVYIHDTVTIVKDSIITKTKYKSIFDTITEIQYKDTVIHDTVRIPIENKVSEFEIKKDSLTIREKIHHHGFKSEIDSVEFSYDWQYTFQPKKQRKLGLTWSIGPYIGYGINFNKGQYYFSPEVGVGVSIGIGGIIK